MMHGYIACDPCGRPLAPFQTWRNTNTQQAADELTDLFVMYISLKCCKQARRPSPQQVGQIPPSLGSQGFPGATLTPASRPNPALAGVSRLPRGHFHPSKSAISRPRWGPKTSPKPLSPQQVGHIPSSLGSQGFPGATSIPASRPNPALAGVPQRNKKASLSGTFDFRRLLLRRKLLNLRGRPFCAAEVRAIS